MKEAFNRVINFTSHVFNGLAIIGLTYVVTHDITVQDILAWVR